RVLFRFAEAALRAEIFPALDESLRHGVVVDRDKEIGLGEIGLRDARCQTRLPLAARQEQRRLLKATLAQAPFDALPEPQVEIEFRHATRADRALRLRRMADVEEGVKGGAVAGSCAGRK